ncbi:hypothetical protein ACU8LZ_25615 (plasmid) [Rhizobium leguminosarum]
MAERSSAAHRSFEVLDAISKIGDDLVLSGFTPNTIHCIERAAFPATFSLVSAKAANCSLLRLYPPTVNPTTT